jgi:hypothetical protein
MCVLLQGVKDLIKQYQSLVPLTLEEAEEHFANNPTAPLILNLNGVESQVFLDRKKDSIYIFATADTKVIPKQVHRSVPLFPKTPTYTPHYTTLKSSTYMQAWFLLKGK